MLKTKVEEFLEPGPGGSASFPSPKMIIAIILFSFLFFAHLNPFSLFLVISWRLYFYKGPLYQDSSVCHHIISFFFLIDLLGQLNIGDGTTLGCWCVVQGHSTCDRSGLGIKTTNLPVCRQLLLPAGPHSDKFDLSSIFTETVKGLHEVGKLQ